jgi:hypothetical protein
MKLHSTKRKFRIKISVQITQLCEIQSKLSFYVENLWIDGLGISAPHAYGPGALLGVWARPAPTPNKLLAGHLVATLPYLTNFELN